MRRLFSTTSALFTAVAALATVLACAAGSGPAYGDEPLNSRFCGSCDQYDRCHFYCQGSCCTYFGEEGGDYCTGICFCESCKPNINLPQYCGCYH